jgi:hypothetical protein
MQTTLVEEALCRIQQHQQQLQQGDNSKPFASLQSLDVFTTSSATLTLLRAMPALTDFDLSMLDAPADQLPCIALLLMHQQLRRLCLAAQSMSTSWPAPLALRGLAQLRKFYLRAATLSWPSHDGTA